MNYNSLFTTMPIMGNGMLGIFIITGIIILSIYILNKLFANKEVK